MKTIFTDKAPKPNGHYAQAVQKRGSLHLSMQVPIDPMKPNQFYIDVDQQTKQVLQNILEIVLAANGKKEDIVEITIYVTDMSLWQNVNEIYSDFMGNHVPARRVVHVQSLPLRYQVGMDAIAILD